MRPLGRGATLGLRIVWFATLLFAVGAVISGTMFVLREHRQIAPVFAARGIDYDYSADGRILLMQRHGQDQKLTGELVGVDGRPVRSPRLLDDLTPLVQALPQRPVELSFRGEDGQVRSLVVPFKPVVRSPDAEQRFALRLLLGLTACTVLLVCSLLLGFRRPSDPVAMLFAFSFALIAASIDPPLLMWMGLGHWLAYDVVGAIWFTLLLIALTSFPDGVFFPRFFRFVLVTSLPLGIFLSLPQVDGNLQALVGIAALLGALLGQVRRYRRLSPGIERQQIKWACFGFAAGFVLLAAAFSLLPFVPAGGAADSPLLAMVVVSLFSLGMALLPLGLLVALLKFRLWEADQVIGRSAAYAAVTLIVGVVWAASADLAKLIIFSIMGEHHETGATTLGAIVAAGVFSPTQSAVLRWSQKHFRDAVERLRDLPADLDKWKLVEPPEVLGARVLERIDAAVHPSAARLELLTDQGAEPVAAIHEAAETSQALPLKDSVGQVGRLLLGKRSDGNRYNKAQLEGLRAILPALADALRTSHARFKRETGMQRLIEEMQTRIAELERRPGPAAG
ncbi:hypothetical protein HMF7854_06565 [Sphingomonas ginkgonis]|uniref:Uncharacterized protein n=1 Tax=Sphingomonas ginkgonis TaxID=2315330 RepID=A0A3R9YLZ9_9SPHN|nr:hypothetical protein [Sphingomonas ginkgonis]RST30530.1 hypothetical protein HMF7854_06565 [Sphingomonas ginkgonis]